MKQSTLFLVFGCAALLLAFVVLPAQAQKVDTIWSSADTYSYQYTPDANNGADVLLRVRRALSTSTDPVAVPRHVYLKFDLSAYTGSPDSAKIRLGCYQVPQYGRTDIYGITDNSWTTTSLTWNNQPDPALGTHIDSLTIKTRSTATSNANGDTVYNMNVTSWVLAQGNTVISFCFADKAYSYDYRNTDIRWSSSRATGTKQLKPALLLYSTATGVGSSKGTVPTRFELAQNFPNPFNPSTQITYTLPSSGKVRVVVYNVLGVAVQTLQDGVKSAGVHQATWSGLAADGSQMASGMYFCTVEFGSTSKTVKMMLLR